MTFICLDEFDMRAALQEAARCEPPDRYDWQHEQDKRSGWEYRTHEAMAARAACRALGLNVDTRPIKLPDLRVVMPHYSTKRSGGLIVDPQRDKADIHLLVIPLNETPLFGLPYDVELCGWVTRYDLPKKAVQIEWPSPTGDIRLLIKQQHLRLPANLPVPLFTNLPSTAR